MDTILIEMAKQAPIAVIIGGGMIYMVKMFLSFMRSVTTDFRQSLHEKDQQISDALDKYNDSTSRMTKAFADSAHAEMQFHSANTAEHTKITNILEKIDDKMAQRRSGES